MIQTLIAVVGIGFAYKLLNESVDQNVPLMKYPDHGSGKQNTTTSLSMGIKSLFLVECLLYMY